MSLDIDGAILTVLKGMSSTGSITAIVKPLCFVFDAKKDTNKGKILRDPNDYPQVRLESKGNTIAVGGPRTFAMNATNFSPSTCNAPIPGRAIVLITVIHEGAFQDTTLESAIDAFLMGKFPTLGLSWVANFSIAKTLATETNDLTKRLPRAVSRRTITFQIRPYHSQLV